MQMTPAAVSFRNICPFALARMLILGDMTFKIKEKTTIFVPKGSKSVLCGDVRKIFPCGVKLAHITRWIMTSLRPFRCSNLPIMMQSHRKISGLHITLLFFTLAEKSRITGFTPHVCLSNR